MSSKPSSLVEVSLHGLVHGEVAHDRLLNRLKLFCQKVDQSCVYAIQERVFGSERQKQHFLDAIQQSSQMQQQHQVVAQAVHLSPSHVAGVQQVTPSTTATPFHKRRALTTQMTTIDDPIWRHQIIYRDNQYSHQWVQYGNPDASKTKTSSVRSIISTAITPDQVEENIQSLRLAFDFEWLQRGYHIVYNDDIFITIAEIFRIPEGKSIQDAVILSAQSRPNERQFLVTLCTVPIMADRIPVMEKDLQCIAQSLADVVSLIRADHKRFQQRAFSRLAPLSSVNKT